MFVGGALLFVLSWRLALALLSALPIIAIAMVLQVCASHLFCLFPLNLLKAMVFSVYSRSSASALAAAAAFANTLIDNCVLVRASGKQERETSHYSDLLSQAEILQRRQALFAGMNDATGVAAVLFMIHLALQLCSLLIFPRTQASARRLVFWSFVCRVSCCSCQDPLTI